MPEYNIQISQKQKTARVLGVITLVLSAFAFVGMAIAAVTSGTAAQDIIMNPAKYADIDASAIAEAVGELGFGAGITDAQALFGTMAFFAMFLGFGAILSLVGIVGSVAVIRLIGRSQTGYRTLALTVISAVVSFVTLRFVSGILFIIEAVLINKDFTEQVGDDRDFTTSKHLGFMRVVEIGCIFMLISNVLLLVFVTRSSVYDASYWVSFLQLILSAVVLWLIWNRKEHGREIIIGIVFAYIIIDVLVQIMTGFDPLNFFVYLAGPVVILVYFIYSRRAKAIMVKPWRSQGRKELLAEDEKLWNPKSLLFWRNLLLYFCIFSVVGHWMEWGVCWLIRWGIVPGEYDPNSGIWRDMLNPFFVYGAAMVFIGLLLFPIKNWLQEKTGNTIVALILSFVVNTLFCAVIELAMGLVLNTPADPVTGHLPLWDYSNMAFNFMGQICLLNTSFFGIMATLMTWLVYPNLEKAFARIPSDVMNILTVVVVVFFVLVVCMYVVNIALPGSLNDIAAYSIA